MQFMKNTKMFESNGLVITPQNRGLLITLGEKRAEIPKASRKALRASVGFTDLLSQARVPIGPVFDWLKSRNGKKSLHA